MKSHRFVSLFALAALAAVASAGSVEKFGKPLQGLKPTTIAEVLAKPEAGKVVRLEGVIDVVCQNQGCWLGLKQGDQAIHVAMEGHAFFVPKDAKGRKVALEGKVVVKDRSKEDVEHLKEEGAKEAASRVSIAASGVEIESAK
jgi:hypothetical protein